MEHVLNETKAREIAKSNGINYKNHSKYEDDMDSTLECYKSALQAMDWKDKQWIEKACDAYCKDCEYIGCDKFECLALEKFRKAMEE